MIKNTFLKRSQNRDKAQVDPQVDHYAALHHGFHWQVDEYFNIVDVCCKRWAKDDAKKPDAIKKVAARAMDTG